MKIKQAFLKLGQSIRNIVQPTTAVGISIAQLRADGTRYVIVADRRYVGAGHLRELGSNLYHMGVKATFVMVYDVERALRIYPIADPRVTAPVIEEKPKQHMVLP